MAEHILYIFAGLALGLIALPFLSLLWIWFSDKRRDQAAESFEEEDGWKP